MESTISLHSLTSLPHKYRNPKTKFNCPKRVSSIRTFVSHDRNCGDWSIVDENMIILRKRIHETKMIEKNYEPPSNWMEWEKRYYTSYDSIICEAMGVLQSHLMNTRPCLAVGVMGLIILSVSTSSAVVFSHLIDLIKGVLGGIN